MNTSSTPPPHVRSRFKHAVMVVAALATLLVLVYSILSFWGRNKWSREQADLKAKGETLDIQALVPPDVPEKDNFFSTPLWQELAAGNKQRGEEFSQTLKGYEKGRGKGLYSQAKKGLKPLSAPMDLAAAAQVAKGVDPSLSGEPAEILLQRLAPAEGVLAELRESARRPAGRFPVQYKLGVVSGHLHVGVLMSASRYLVVRIAAEASLGRGSEAEENVLLLIRLQKTLEGEPDTMSQLVRLSIMEMITDSVWEGIYRQCWNAGQLKNIQTQLASIELRKSFIQGLRGDRAALVPMFEMISRVPLFPKNPGAISEFPLGLLMMAYPKGLVFDDLANYCNLIQQTIDTIQQAPDKQTFDPVATAQALESQMTYWPIKMLSRMSYSVLGKSYMRLLQCEAGLNEAIIACSLEQERLVSGTYPDVLPAGMPSDPVTWQALHYRKNPDGGYVLWSPALDKTNDQGALWDDKKKTGDWAWAMPWR